MNTRSPSDLAIDQYLAELDAALASLPASRRNQILDEIRDHIKESRGLLDVEDESSISALLERIGEPEAIAAEAGAVDGDDESRRSDAWVPWLLLLGGIPSAAFWLLGIGWILGVGFLWASARWGLRDKLIGTLVLPGGLLPLVLLLIRPVGSYGCDSHGGPGVPTSTHCTTSGMVLAPAFAIPLFIVLLVAPVFTLVWLKREPRSP
jgi:hypothetical protein